MTEQEWVVIDGAMGEGGGQILRSSLALSVITGKPVRIEDIRGRRANPGLQAQHLAAVRAIAQIAQAEVVGDRRGSRQLTFIPHDVQSGKYHFSVGTAGSTGLVLQTIYLPLALGGQEVSEVVITGGTHGMWAPCYEFLASTWAAYLRHMGISISLRMLRPGFYPRGGGTIRAVIKPADAVRPLRTAGSRHCTCIRCLSVVANLPRQIAERQAGRAKRRLRAVLPNLRFEPQIEQWRSESPGTLVALEVDTSPAPTLFFALGARGKKAERVADEAVDQLLRFLESPDNAVDPHSADQLVLPLAFAQGRSAFEISEVTEHLRTNIEVIKRFVDRNVTCIGNLGEPGRVVIE